MRTMFASLLVVLPMAALAEAPEAVAPGTPLANSPVASLLPLVLIFFVFYFLLIKPQQRRAKEHQATLGALKKGDEVITGGGIVGRITKVNDDNVTVEISKGVEVTMVKSSISGLVSAPSTVAPAKKKSAGNKNDNAVPSRDSVANDN